MESAQAPSPSSVFLPRGTVVGSWRMVDWGGQGVHGVVYRAERVGDEQAGPVALKLALVPRDPRFAREVELLSRLRHPSIPRLWDHGEWQHPNGTRHPYIVMDWVQGVPLYDWARECNPTAQQVYRLLAQLARALEAIHAQGSVHRDLKGDNVLVRRGDSRAVLTDFGMRLYPGAATLTPQTLIPGTPAYRSPEAWLFLRRLKRHSTAHYAAGPADDVYALGTTAYRLVTGSYPEFGEFFKDEAGAWQLGALISPSPLALNPRVDKQLSALILRMLSLRPEERGTAAQWAEVLEQETERAVPERVQMLFAREPRSPWTGAQMEVQVPEKGSRAEGSAKLVRPRVLARHGWLWRAMAAAGVVLAVWAWWAARERPVEEQLVARKEATDAGQKGGGTAGLGDAVSVAFAEGSPDTDVCEAIAEHSLPEPSPGQMRPDAKGRCPHKRQVALNGGCWMPVAREECEAFTGQMFKDRCYAPVLSPGRAPTSGPAGSTP